MKITILHSGDMMELSIEEKINILNARIYDMSRQIYLSTVEKGAEEAANFVADEPLSEERIQQFDHEIARLGEKLAYYQSELDTLNSATPSS